MKPDAKFKFLLYVAGGTQNSQLAVANLTALCQQHLSGRHEIEIVDVFSDPDRALADHVFMTPTLIKLAPAPIRRLVGTLSQPAMLLHALGLEQAAA